MCEALHCTTREARWELDEDPERMALRVLELRAYAETKRQIEAAKTAKECPTGPLADLVQEVEVDLWRARKARRGR